MTITPTQAGDCLDLETVFAGKGRTYTLRVQTDDWAGRQIRQGDLLVIEDRQPKRGERIVYRTALGLPLLAEFVSSRGTLQLSVDKSCHPLRFYPDDGRLLGVMVGLVRPASAAGAKAGAA